MHHVLGGRVDALKSHPTVISKSRHLWPVATASNSKMSKLAYYRHVLYTLALMYDVSIILSVSYLAEMSTCVMPCCLMKICNQLVYDV